MNPMIPSIVLSASICALLIGLLVWNWRRIEAALGNGGILIYLTLTAFFPLQCLLWPLSLSPLLNDTDDPIVLGTGGAVYGLNYEDYLTVTSLMSTIPALSFALLLYLSRTTPPAKDKSDASAVLGLSSFLSLISAPLLFLSAAFFLEFFHQEGFSRIWSSPLARFEGVLWETGVESGSQSGSPFMRLYLLFLFFSSIVAAVGIAFRTRRFLNSTTLLLNLPAFLVWESRGLSVVISVGLLGWFFSFKNPRTRRIAIAPVLIAILIIYQVPLILRELPGTGVVKFGAAGRLISESNEYSVRACAVRTMQNLSQSFPNFAYYYQEYSEGVNEMDQLPLGYKLLSLSPTISMVDHWAQDYMDLQLRVNYFTPISAWSELFLMSPCLPYLVVTLFSVTVLLLMRQMAQTPLGRLVFSPVVALLYAVTLAMSSQYYTRILSRYAWLTIGACVVFGLVGKASASRWNSPHRIATSRPTLGDARSL
jgi:hypothetical protein